MDSLMSVFRKAYSSLIKNFWNFFLGTVAYVFISLLLFPTANLLYILFFLPVMLIGFVAYTMKSYRGEKPNLYVIFEGFNEFGDSLSIYYFGFLVFFLSLIVFVIVPLGLIFILFFKYPSTFFIFISSLWITIFSIFMVIRLSFSMYYYLDRKGSLKITDIYKEVWEKTREHAFRILGAFLILIILSIIYVVILLFILSIFEKMGALGLILNFFIFVLGISLLISYNSFVWVGLYENLLLGSFDDVNSDMALDS